MTVGAEREPEIRTLPPDVVAGDLRRIHVLRDIALALVALLALVGATGLLGVRAGSEAVSADGYDVQVDYPRITRGGLPADFDIRVERPGGFGGNLVTIAVTKEHLELFDIRRVFPSPVREASDRSLVYWTFEPPPSDILDVSLTAETGETLGQVGIHDAEMQVIVGGSRVAQIPLSTVVVP
ncbi:hypothetical protein ACVGVM_23505 [Pseudonocardia bannensis]|uniref:Uncharacterized protein n=1 Tax=Pseudonocardia bannensis TaxID=630973 RepID=A0A848DL23_9PSEU|nr:hypothetical protein [Pseudonocardia bannensis]NMH93402.1 hypothetical protein [Pseudonocardia bannensis]